MSLNIQRKPCSICEKSIGILTCDGCEQIFCAKHINDHRQKLSIEMDTIGQECDLLRRDLTRDEKYLLPLLEQINHWEKESIEKIQQIAEQTRTNLKEYLAEKINKINKNLEQLVGDFQTSQHTGDYTEIDFRLWIERINQLRKVFDTMPTIETNNEPTIPIIKLQKKTDDIPKSPQELFDQIMITSNDVNQRSTIVYINELYTTGIHEVYFQIERKSSQYVFFGIVNSSKQVKRRSFSPSSIYGWLAPDVRVINNQKHPSAMTNRLFQTGDEVILTVNCSKKQILLEHPATNTIDRIPIDLHICPFPWKVVRVFLN